MQHNYPIILIPKEIQNIKNATILPHKAPTKPIAPEAFEPSRAGWYCLLCAVVIATAVPLLGIIVCLIGIVLVYHNNKMNNEYLQKTQLFATALQEYEIKNNLYKAAKKDSFNKQNDGFALKIFRENELKRILATTATPKIAIESPKGKSEKDFYIILNKYFENCIFINKGIEFFNNRRAYLPDFIFIHKNSNLHIDIEIDEPYVATTGQPIHYFDYQGVTHFSIDDVRNFYFMGKGWCVIRFAEEQVVRYPTECCKVIAKVIYDVIEDGTYINKFSTKNNLPSIKHWTKTEAIAMYQKDFRNQYYINQPNNNTS